MSNLMKNSDVNTERKSSIYEEFEKNYKDAFYSVDKAITLEEEGALSEALLFYENGLKLIDKALDLDIAAPTKPDLSWEKAVVMKQKLQKTRKEIIIRIENVKAEPSVEAPQLPPSYEEVIASSKPVTDGTNNTDGNCSNNFQLPGSSKTDLPYIPSSALHEEKLLANLHDIREGSSNASVTYSGLSQQLKEMKLAKNEEIIYYCDNVQMYFIAPDGRVSSTSQPSKMIIARLYDETLDPVVQTFLQVDSWIYPLIPKVSFCSRSDFGAFIFPDVNSNEAGAAVGLILPEDVGDEVQNFFSEFLNEPDSEGRFRRNTVADFAPHKNTSKFLRGTFYVAHYLVKGAANAAQFLDSSTPKLIDRINPKDQPQAINPTVRKAVEVAKTVSGAAVNVTDYLSTKVSSATSALGRYMSPYVQKEGSQLLAYITNTTEEVASQKINSVISTTSDALEGVSVIYNGLETAATILSRSLANNTVQIIEYKYGQEAGTLTNDAITTFGNVYYTRHNFKYLKPKGIAKSALKGTGRALAEDCKKLETSLRPHDEFRGAGPGSGSGISPSP